MSSLSAITASAKAALSAKKEAKKKANRFCTFCRRKDHDFSECPLAEPKIPQAVDLNKGCNNCGNPGHWASECQMDAHVAKMTSKVKRCTICKAWKHLAIQCPLRFQQKGGKAFSLTKPCSICGNNGHWARECAQSRKIFTRKNRCKWCGKKDHPNYECKKKKLGLVNRRTMDINKLKRLNKKTPLYYRREKEGAPLSLREQKRRSVVEIKNIPMALQEEEMLKFFKQFGFITRCSLMRTSYGRPLGTGYIEFAHPAVGKIVADTMDVTSLYGHMLEVSVVKPELVDGISMFPRRRIKHAKVNYKWAASKHRWENVARIANLELGYSHFYKRLIEDEDEINANLKKHGIDYEFHGMKEAAAKRTGKRKYVKSLTTAVDEEELNPSLEGSVPDMNDDDKAMANCFMMDQEDEDSDEDSNPEEPSKEDSIGSNDFEW